MNGFIASAFAILAVTCHANAFLWGGSDSVDARLAQSFSGRDALSAADRASLSFANRFKDAEARKSLSSNSADLAAKTENGERVAIANKQAGESYLSANSMEEFAAENVESDSSKFGLSIIDQKDHDEGSKVAYRRANERDEGNKFVIDQAYDSELIHNAQLAAQAENLDEAASQRETAAEELNDEKAEKALDTLTEVDHEVLAEGIGGVENIFGGRSSILGSRFGGKLFNRRR